jgi:hypothetical protein
MDDLEKTPVEKQDQLVDPLPLSRREEWRRSRGGDPWMAGVILILIGVAFLMQNLTGLYINKWWTVFILIPAFRSFNRAWHAMQDAEGRLTSRARSAFIGGLVLTAVAAILFFSLDWIIFGPILLIVVGAAILLNVILPK